MEKNKILKICPAVGIIALLIFISPTCSAGNIMTEKSSYIEDNFCKIKTLNMDPPGYFLYGEKGENNWYISCVSLTFNWDPDLVKEVWIYINGDWKKYTSPVEICLDGNNNIPWKWIDMDDQTHFESPISIKIDKTPPLVNLEKKIDSETQITFTAKVTDPASGAEKVDFYLDDNYKETDTEAPFEYIWQGTGLQTIKAVAFDYAGFTGEDTANTKPRARNYIFKDLLLGKPLQNLLNIIIWSQKILQGLIL